MKHDHHDESFAGRVRNELNAGLERLDPAISARLAAFRHRAMTQCSGEAAPSFSFMRLASLTGVALVVVLVTVVSLWYGNYPSMSEYRAEEIEMLASQGSLDMYRDLEFYTWLADTHEIR